MKIDMAYLECLLCLKKFEHDLYYPFCPDCREPGLVVSENRKRRLNLHKNDELAIEKFSDFLPLNEIKKEFSLGEGATPMVRLTELSRSLELDEVYAKNEAQNPTGSFKDRGTSVAIQKLRELKVTRVGTVSTGNMAASTAAYGARAGFKTFIFLKEGTSLESLHSIAVYGPDLVCIRGSYKDLYWKSFELGRKFGIYMANSTDPFRIEGYKCTGFEIFCDLNRLPDFIFLPVSAGGHFLGLIRAFEELYQEKLIDRMPRFVGVQSKGCSPLVRAFENGQNFFVPFENPSTIAHAISNPSPPAGRSVLAKVRQHDGIFISVKDEELILAQKVLAASEGIFCQVESASVVAALKRLVAEKQIRSKDTVVLIITGSGLKQSTLPGIDTKKSEEITLAGLEEWLSLCLK